jgi:hypothetical protein
MGLINGVIPIRRVLIERVWSTGTTIAVIFRVDAFAFAGNIAKFRDAFYSSPHPPRNAPRAAQSGGLWFYESDSSLSNELQSSTDLKDWEETAKALVSIPQFRKEPFFWTVLSLKEGVADEMEADSTFSPWPEVIKAGETHTLVLYVFRASRFTEEEDNEVERTGWVGQLAVKSDPPLSNAGNSPISIDSPYDLLRWSFQIKRPFPTFNDHVRITIGEEAFDKSALAPLSSGDRTAEQIRNDLREKLRGNTQWDIELPLRLNSPWPGILAVGVVLGILLAAPSLPGIWLQTPGPNYHPKTATLLAVLAGWLAAVFAVFQIRKPT